MPLVTVKVTNNTPTPAPTTGGAPDAAAPGEAARAGGGVALAQQQRGAAGTRHAASASNTPVGEGARAAAQATQHRASVTTSPAHSKAPAAATAPRDGFELRGPQDGRATRPGGATSLPPTAGAPAAMPRPQGPHHGVAARPHTNARTLTNAGPRRNAPRAGAGAARSTDQSGEAGAVSVGERKSRSDDDDPARTRASTSSNVSRGPWTSAGTLAPPAVRPAAPAPFSASVTALGYAAAARRAQAESVPAQRALRPPIADVPRPQGRGTSNGVTVGGRPASPLAARPPPS